MFEFAMLYVLDGTKTAVTSEDAGNTDWVPGVGITKRGWQGQLSLLLHSID